VQGAIFTKELLYKQGINSYKNELSGIGKAPELRSLFLGEGGRTRKAGVRARVCPFGAIGGKLSALAIRCCQQRRGKEGAAAVL
jgi:hypothetical protein